MPYEDHIKREAGLIRDISAAIVSLHHLEYKDEIIRYQWRVIYTSPLEGLVVYSEGYIQHFNPPLGTNT